MGTVRAYDLGLVTSLGLEICIRAVTEITFVLVNNILARSSLIFAAWDRRSHGRKLGQLMLSVLIFDFLKIHIPKSMRK